MPRAGGVPKSWPPKLPINPPLLEVAMMHKVILLVLAGYPSVEAYARAEVEEELRQREHSIAAELAKRPHLAAAVLEARASESIDPIYRLAGLTAREVGAFERVQRGTSAKQVALEMSQNKDRPEITVVMAEHWIAKARRKLRALGEEPAATDPLLVSEGLQA